MTVPDLDTLLTYGGATNDYSPPASVLYARKSQYVNQSLSRGAGMTVTAFRSVITFYQVSSVWNILYERDVWGNGVGNTPVSISRTGAGNFLLTWPSTVVDDIPSGFPGYMASHNVNIRASYAGFNDNNGTNDFVARSAVVSSTTVLVFVRAGSSRTLTDPPVGTFVSVWVI